MGVIIGSLYNTVRAMFNNPEPTKEDGYTNLQQIPDNLEAVETPEKIKVIMNTEELIKAIKGGKAPRRTTSVNVKIKPGTVKEKSVQEEREEETR